MPPLIDDFDEDGDVPTEEIYLELTQLEATAATQSQDQDLPSPIPSTDVSGIKTRIAQLRAMLSDRGAPYEH
ncbi:MAG: hypothetical protein ACR2N7_05810 [Acidimicrobiia bacterium]